MLWSLCCPPARRLVNRGPRHGVPVQAQPLGTSDPTSHLAGCACLSAPLPRPTLPMPKDPLGCQPTLTQGNRGTTVHLETPHPRAGARTGLGMGGPSCTWWRQGLWGIAGVPRVPACAPHRTGVEGHGGGRTAPGLVGRAGTELLQRSQLRALLRPNRLQAGWSPSVQPAGPQRLLQ